MLNNDLAARMAKDLGSKGTYLASGTTAGDWVKINCVTDAAISVEVDWVTAGSPQALTLVAGQSIYGKFTSITVTTGTVVAY